MIRIFLLILVVTLLVLVIKEAKRYFARDRKLEEFKDEVIEAEIAEIELDIAMEKSRKRGLYEAVKDLESKHKTGEK